MASSAIRRNNVHPQNDVTVFTSRIVQGFQRLRSRSLTSLNLRERQKKTKDVPDGFDPHFYWRWFSSSEEPIAFTQSQIREIIPYRQGAFAICSNGEMMRFDVNEDGLRIWIAWETQLYTASHPSLPRVQLWSSSPQSPETMMNKSVSSGALNSTPSSSSDNGVRSRNPITFRYSSPAIPTGTLPVRISHAALNMVTRIFYFTSRTEGIFMARLSNIEARLHSPDHESTSSKFLTPVKPVINRASHPEMDGFSGLAVDSVRYLLFCCCNLGISVWSSYQHPLTLVAMLKQPLFSPANHLSNAMPYSCCIFPDPTSGAHATLIVADKVNSEIIKFNLQYYTPNAAGPAISAAILDTQSLALPGNRLGFVLNPQGVCFDNAGNILIADNGNQRVQVFRYVEPSTCNHSEIENTWIADDIIPVKLGMFEQLKVITPLRLVSAQNMGINLKSSITRTFKRHHSFGSMIILSGLAQSFGKFPAGKIFSLSYFPEHSS